VTRTLLHRIAAASTAGAAAIGFAAGPSSAATAPVSQPRILVHYDLAAGQQPENVAVEPDGKLDVTLSRARMVERVTPEGRQRVLATLPAPADGGVNTPVTGFAAVTGIVRTPDGTLLVGYSAGDAGLTGVWRIRPGHAPERIVALPASGFPNGMALDARTGLLYVADSIKGTVWRVPASGGSPTAWATGPLLSLTTFIGVNGLKLHNGALWATNSDQATLLRIPIGRDGSPGTIQVRATGLTSIDDFAFAGRGDTAIAALNLQNEVALVRPDGTSTIVLTGQDGLEGPTSVAIEDGRVFVMSASYILQKDPNILVADLDVRH
jgi:hypothetical protein